MNAITINNSHRQIKSALTEIITHNFRPTPAVVNSSIKHEPVNNFDDTGVSGSAKNCEFMDEVPYKKPFFSWDAVFMGLKK